MANPSNFGADAAYDRAVAAFGEHSYDVARRWVLEALAHNPEHAGARALLARLDSVRRPPNPAARAAGARPSPFGAPLPTPAPATVSTDPTVLISRADLGPAPDGIEPTVMIRRNEPARTPAAVPDPFRAPIRPAPQYDTRPTSEPTIIGRPAAPPPPAPPRPAPRPSAPADGGLMQRVRDLFGVSAASPAKARTPQAGMPGLRGAALVLGAVVAAALFLWAGYLAVRWMWPGGVALGFDRPTGGTISGPGIECGSKGKDCSTTRPKGETVALDVQADSGYVFGGFTGDCPDSGRLVMNGPRKCGAKFNAVGAGESTAPVAFTLTVTKPQGGSITADGVILCGTLGNDCSASVPAGTPVRMGSQADTNFTFASYTGDCAPTGEMLMNAAKTCGAIFMPTPTGTVVNRAPTDEYPIKRATVKKPEDPPKVVTPPANTSSIPPPPLVQGPPSTPAPPQVPPGPVKDPISAEDHARQEIEDLVKRFCAANETLKAENVRNLFPLAPMAAYREQFGVYRSLKCTITSKPEFQRLDARDIGGAQVLFEMKQVMQMKKGGAPKVLETQVTMVVSRLSFQAPWRIDRINAEEKPK